MSDLSSAQASLLRLFGPLEGARVPGGCDACDAYQTVEAVAPGAWKINICHDDGCPVLADVELRRAS